MSKICEEHIFYFRTMHVENSSSLSNVGEGTPPEVCDDVFKFMRKTAQKYHTSVSVVVCR